MILFAIALLLFGATADNGLTRYLTAPHRHARAVMTLAQFHFDRLATAAKSGQCAEFVEQRERLFRVYAEMLDAFPKTYAQDPEFHKRAEAFRAAVHPDLAAVGECGSAAADAKHIDEACDACHQEYR